jgi:hypothetical protein
MAIFIIVPPGSLTATAIIADRPCRGGTVRRESVVARRCSVAPAVTHVLLAAGARSANARPRATSVTRGAGREAARAVAHARASS